MKYLKNNRGVALVYVVMVLLIASVLIGAAAVMVSSNTREVSAQEIGIQSYYIARSGVELAYEAVYDGGDPAVYNAFLAATAPRTQNNVNIGEGQVNIVLEKITPVVGGVQRGRITSVGHLDGQTLTRTVILEFDLIDGANILWRR